ncbi:hypothetical protein KY313_00640 [Candidatus Woesearchaeota archaeon]|jgi:ribosomal protein S24E|nr:hypothetical protein [Candidatus Woesearchaeota archaeon]
MNITILKQEKQPLLSRTEVSAKVSFKGSTPSKEEIQKNIASKLKQKEELTVIKHIYNEFGSQEAKIEAFIYDDTKVMSVLEKSKKKENKPAAEKPVESKEESEQPVEEKSQESKKEEQKEQPTEKPAEQSKELPKENKEEKSE